MAIDPRRSIDVVLEELAQVPEMVNTQVDTLWDTVRTLLRSVDAAALNKVVLTGCGDSLYAGMAARWAMERYGGIAAEAIEALDFCRYAADSQPPGTLVVPISYSGQVARTVETAWSARHYRASVIAITGRPERRLAQTAGTMLHVQVPSLGFSLGTSTYIGLALSVYVLAIGLGLQRGVLDEQRAAQLLEELRAAGSRAGDALDAGSEVISNLAPWLLEGDSVVFLGAGPHYASALFGAAKLFEGAQLHGVAQNTEEWAHAQYFISDSHSRTVLLAPAGRSAERSYEIAREMRFIETPFLVITDQQPARWQELTPHVLSLPSGTPEVFSPLLFAVPLSQIGYHLARLRGKQSYNFPSAEREREHYETLHDSPFLDPTSLEERW